MKFTKRIFASLMLICSLVAIAPIGCASKLETGGAYAKDGVAPDKGFFAADAAYDIAYSSIDAAFNFEKNNRQLLWQVSPEIKHTLDDIRPQALLIARQYAVARQAYLANPTPAGLDNLQTILGRTRQLASAAQAALPK